eukprot:333000-Rhodomonas_salina.2
MPAIPCEVKRKEEGGKKLKGERERMESRRDGVDEVAVGKVLRGYSKGVLRFKLMLGFKFKHAFAL